MQDPVVDSRMPRTTSDFPRFYGKGWQLHFEWQKDNVHVLFDHEEFCVLVATNIEYYSGRKEPVAFFISISGGKGFCRSCILLGHDC